MDIDSSEPLNLTIMARQGVIYSGQVRAISSVNERGNFDVVSRHTNFLSLLTAPITVYKTTGDSFSVPADNAIMRVENNKVTVYLGIKSGLR